MPKEKDLETILNIRISFYLEEVYVSLYKSIQYIKEDYGARGLLPTGAFVGAVSKYIIEDIEKSLNLTIIKVLEIEKELNITYSENQLNYINKILVDRYRDFIVMAFDNHYFNDALIISGIDHLSDYGVICRDEATKKVIHTINTIIKDAKVKRKIRKEPLEVRQAKYSNIISTIALMISIISILISINNKPELFI